ncbi:MAG: phage portal protein [Candidatus Pelethousia sp.]|nr:phage portal protein [Candidatus Pelethousia sp.]
MLTKTDIINMQLSAAAPMSTGEIIRELLKEDAASEEYRLAREGEAYYRAKHAVLHKDFRCSKVETTGVDENTKQEVPVYEDFINPNASNERLPHPFFHNHIEQKINYTLGKEPSISVTGQAPEGYGKALAETTDAKFNKAIKSWAKQASKHGKAFLREYKDAEGKLRQAVVNRFNLLPIYDTALGEDLVEAIYYYPMKVRLTKTQTVDRIVAEWWTDRGVTYWISDHDGPFLPDPDRPGKQPHYWEVTYVTAEDGVTMTEKSRIPKSWGRVPFIELRNNEEASTDLERYKGLIDAYDMVASTGTNNLLDFNEFWLAIQGYGGDTASSIARKLKINKAVGVNGQGGNIEMKQFSLDMAGRIAWLKVLREAIHEFGMAVDLNNDRFGNAPSGVALKFQYTLLDLKADGLIGELQPALQEHFWFVTEELNRKNGTDYDAAAIEVAINKSMITNDTELVNMIGASVDLVPERILLAAHPLVIDPDAAMKEMEEQRKRKAKEAQAAFGQYGQPPGGGDE